MAEPAAPESFRLFVALDVPEAVKAEVARAQEELRRAVGGLGVRWASQAQFHLTLRFLGDVEAARLESLVVALRGAAAAFGPLQMRAQGVGFFPHAHRPRVLWVGVEDQAGRLAHLQQAVQAATLAFTDEEEETRFTGHLTLARIKMLRRRESEALARVAAGMAERAFGDWVATELELIRSQLSSQGSIYTSLARVPLTQYFT